MGYGEEIQMGNQWQQLTGYPECNTKELLTQLLPN